MTDKIRDFLSQNPAHYFTVEICSDHDYYVELRHKILGGSEVTNDGWGKFPLEELLEMIIDDKGRKRLY